jgi:hypothetical protein
VKSNRKAKLTRPTISIPIETILLLPGIFEQGSESDQVMLENHLKKPDQTWKMKDPLVQLGVIGESVHDPRNVALSQDFAKSPDISFIYDSATLLEIDYRVRFCRCVLNLKGLPYRDCDIIVYHLSEASFDKVSGVINPGTWDFEYADREPKGRSGFTGIQTNSIDYLIELVGGGPTNLYKTPWYAAKILSHFRRAEQFLEIARVRNLTFQEAIGFAREWMLFGETWREADFVINQAKRVVTGDKVRRGSSKGVEVRKDNKLLSQDPVMKEVERLKRDGHTLKAASEIASKKFHINSEAIRRRFYRQSKK